MKITVVFRPLVYRGTWGLHCLHITYELFTPIRPSKVQMPLIIAGEIFRSARTSNSGSVCKSVCNTIESMAL